MKTITRVVGGTSFHGTIVYATVKELREILEVPFRGTNDGRDKVNFEWIQETNDGSIFTVYDYKEYRILRENEVIEWHIGGFNKRDTDQALIEITAELSKVKLPVRKEVHIFNS